MLCRIYWRIKLPRLYIHVCVYVTECLFIIRLHVSVFTPIVMNSLDKRGLLKKFPWANAPLQLLLCGFFLTFATPMCCALFPQKSPISVTKLEKEIQVQFIISDLSVNRIEIFQCICKRLWFIQV